MQHHIDLCMSALSPCYQNDILSTFELMCIRLLDAIYSSRKQFNAKTKSVLMKCNCQVMSFIWIWFKFTKRAQTALRFYHFNWLLSAKRLNFLCIEEFIEFFISMTFIPNICWTFNQFQLLLDIQTILILSQAYQNSSIFLMAFMRLRQSNFPHNSSANQFDSIFNEFHP